MLKKVIVIMFFTQIVFGSANTLKKNQGYIWNGFSLSYFDKLKLPNDQTVTFNETTKYYRNNLFIAYGLLSYLTFFTGFTFQLPSKQNDDILTNLGDSLIGFKGRIYNSRKHKLSLSTSMKTPLSDYPIENLNSLGDGQVDFNVLFNYSFYRNNFSWHFSTGYRARDKDPADQMVFRSNIKYVLPGYYFLSLSANYLKSIKGVDYGSLEFNTISLSKGLGVAFTSLEISYLTLSISMEKQLLKGIYGGISYSTVILANNAALVNSFGINIGTAF